MLSSLRSPRSGRRRLPAVRWSVAALLLGVPPLAAPPAAAAGSAFEELERLRTAYAGLEAYSDHGEILRTVRDAAGREFRQRFAFELARTSEGFRFLLRPEAGSDQLVWRRGGEAFHFDGDRGEVRAIESPAAALFGLVGEGAQDALLVASLLLDLPQALPEPEAAAVEDSRRDDRPVRILQLSAFGGSLRTELTIDARIGLVRRLTVEVKSSLGTGSTVAIEVLHHPAPGVAPAAANWLEAPAGARPVEEWTPRPEPSSEIRTAGGSAAPGTYGETIEVALLTYPVRVLRPDRSPVRGLGPQDFRVRVGRRELAVTAVDWVDAGTSPAADLPPEVLAEAGITLPPPGRLLVFFVQAGLQGGRTQGHLKQLRHVRRLLDDLDREDRVAVVSFDSHLKLRLDFTRDRDAVLEALADSIRFGEKVEPLAAGRYPSLARAFDFDEALRAAVPERALELTAQALEPLLGEKELIFVGWGVGHFADGGVRYDRRYFRAREALARARAAVSVLDISEADFHTLEIGLKQIAHDTGGTYERVFRQGGRATDRLSRSLEGHYLVTFENPDPGRPPKASRLRITLRGGGAEVVVAPVPSP